MWWFVLSIASLCSRRVIDWDEDACNAVPGFVPTLTGGDGDDTQFCKHRFDFTGGASLLSLYYSSLRWVLAYPVFGGGSSSRHKPETYVYPAFKTTTPY